MSSDFVLVAAAIVLLAIAAPLIIVLARRFGPEIDAEQSVTLPNNSGAHQHPSVTNSTLEPHMHVVDGVVITHAHARGDQAHEHTHITVSMKHYAALVRRASQQDASDR